MRGNVNEECGVFGIWQPEEGQVAQIVYHGLVALQHRGEEAAGIAVNRGRVITCDKDLGARTPRCSITPLNSYI